MVARGQTPPNVRTDIDDAPPDPHRAPSEPRAQPRQKPWERPSTAATPAPSTPREHVSGNASPPVPTAGTAAPWAAPPASLPPAPVSVLHSSGNASYPVPAVGTAVQWATPPAGPPPAPLSVLQPLQTAGATAWQPPAAPAPTLLSAQPSASGGSGGARSPAHSADASQEGRLGAQPDDVGSSGLGGVGGSAPQLIAGENGGGAVTSVDAQAA